jgi:hypothetical protein
MTLDGWGDDGWFTGPWPPQEALAERGLQA